MNVGATAPEDAGRYFKWGDTRNRQVGHGMFGSSSPYQYIGDDIAGKEEYDVATSWWGSEWQMPSKELFQEMLDNTTSTWTTLNGVKGRLFTSTINQNTIFLPVTDFADSWGFHSSNFGDEYKNYGYYWTSTFYAPCANETDSRYRNAWAWYLHIYSYGAWFEYYDNCVYRTCGLTVRPVKPGNNN